MKTRDFGDRLRYVVAGWAVLETMLFGGLVNGWASLVFVLKEDGFYSDLCDAAISAASASPFVGGGDGDNGTSATAFNGTTVGSDVEWEEDQPGSCTAQDGKLNLWFTIATALRNIFGIVVGLHIFKFGTRSARLTGWVLFSIGALMMAFANQSNPWLVLPSLMTLSYGGVTLLLTNVQVSCLFPQAAGVIVTLVSGGFDFSAATQLAVKMLYESGLVSRLYSFVGLAGLHAVMVLFSTFCFMPKHMLVYKTPEEDLTPETPSQSPRLRQRRDSLYDWSEIKVHTHHHGLKCGGCEDSSNDGEQREQAATNLGDTVQQSGVHTNVNKYHCPCELKIKASNMLENGIPTEHLDKIRDEKITSSNMDVATHPVTTVKVNGNPVNEANFSHAKKLVARNFPRLDHTTGYLHDVGHETKPYFQSQEGIHELNNNTQICTIAETPARAEKERNGKTNISPGKFISIIDVGSPQSQTSQGETHDPFSEDRRKTDAIRYSQDQVAVNGSLNVTGNGPHRPHHKVTLDLHLQEGWNETESNPTVSDEEAEEEKKKKEAEKNELYPTLKSCLQSGVFWLHVLWHSFNVLRLVAFFGLINPKLTAIFQGDKDKVSFFTNVQAYFMLTILGVCWISGAVYDWQISLFKGRTREFQRRVLPGALPLAMTSLVGAALSVTWMMDSVIALYVMFALFVFYNAFIFGICMTFILRVFPERYFGILNGLLSIIAGTFCFLQYAIFVWNDAYPEGPLHADVFMLLMVVLSLVHPLHIIIKSMV